MINGESDRPVRRRWPLWTALGVIAVALLCALPVALGITLLGHLERVPSPAGASSRPSATPPRSPQPGDPSSVSQAWLRERIGALLDQQAAALLRGDEPGFLAVAAPQAAAATDLKRQFRSLRAMRVTNWRAEIRTAPLKIEDGTREWRVLITYEHCFVVPDCETGPVVVSTRWVETTGGPRMVRIEPSAGMPDGPRPWEVSELVVAVGERALVATTPAFRSRLPGLLKEAEAAAAVADRYAVDGPVPDRYRIFYAGEAEWKRWYGGDRPQWTAGYAVSVGGDHYEIMLNGKSLPSTVVDDLLRHEMTHASSLPGEGYRTGTPWWLVEGVAEQAAAGGRPVSRYEGLQNVRKLVAEGWSGALDHSEPAADAAAWQVSARYGVGYLAVRHLVDRFGEGEMLAFFKAVVHDGATLAEAARQAFGEDWSVLQGECVSAVRRAAS